MPAGCGWDGPAPVRVEEGALGRRGSAAQTAEYRDVLKQEADLTSGHGIMRYTGLISISAPDQEALQAAVAAVEQAAVQASCETRALVGQQAQAFTVAALPLCRAVASIGCLRCTRISTR